MAEAELGQAIIDQLPLAGPIGSAVLVFAWVTWKIGRQLVSVLVEMKTEMTKHNASSDEILKRVEATAADLQNHRLQSGNSHSD